jgi:hypothetical protein
MYTQNPDSDYLDEMDRRDRIEEEILKCECGKELFTTGEKLEGMCFTCVVDSYK